jgi:hypothetical protein
MALKTAVLTTLGFTRVQDFQRAWNLGPALVVDGIWGPKTSAAGSISLHRHNQKRGDISAHFSAREFRCKCGGVLAGCHKTVVLRELLVSLETLRTHTGPLSIVSGYRCPQHNAKVGGATTSQHLYGAAADIPGILTVGQVKALHIFAGIGYRGSDSKAVHVDRRDKSGHNPTKSTTSQPATWPY